MTIEDAEEAERGGDVVRAEELWLEALASLPASEEPAQEDVAVVAQCFAGLGRVAEKGSRPREALLMLNKAIRLFERLQDEKRGSEARQLTVRCRAALGEFPDLVSRTDMAGYAVVLAETELARSHFHHCAQVLDCAEALDGDELYTEAIEKTRRNLARFSGGPVRTKKRTPSEALELLRKIEEADLGSRWTRSWWPLTVVGISVVSLVAVVVWLYRQPSRDSRGVFDQD